MKNLKQLTAIVLCTVFATMQTSLAMTDTGLGVGNGGAVINSATGGYDGLDTGAGFATLNFKGNSHVNWNTLNINRGETLNFNTREGVNGVTVLNTVNQNMSKIYGNINADKGISNLIISNPNGVLFDGAKFTTAGDTNLSVTTRNMTNVNVDNISDGVYTNMRSTDWGTNGSSDLIQVQVKDSNFSVGGDFNIYAPKIIGTNSSIKANSLKLVTANGADYISNIPAENKLVTKLSAMNIDGDVVVTNDVGAFAVEDGGNINGNLTSETGGWVRINETANDNLLNIKGDANIKAHGQQSMLRHSVVDGNLAMSNDGGFVDVGNVHVKGDADLTTTGWQPINHEKFNHYVHVIGNSKVDGDLNIESSQNIHIGNYKVTQVASGSQPWKGELLDGKLTVGGNLKAHTTGGHIMTTIDTSAKNIDFNAESHKEASKIYGGNILSDGKSTLTANTYKFKSNGYIGALKESNGYTIDDKIVNVMEDYTFIPDDTPSHEYMNIAGGTITKLETPKISERGRDVQVYIKSNNDLLVSGANAGVVNLVAPDKKITITGNGVEAKEFNIGGRTGTLQLDFPSRKFTTKYTNIKDNEIKTINGDDEITYELTNKPGVGYNSPDFKQTNGTNTTYLVGPGAPEPGPDPGPDPGPGPDPKPDPKPTPTKKPTDDDNVRVKNWVPEDPMKPTVSTPVAFAADLDDDEISGPCRKNVDGSVTVVRAYPVVN